MKIIYYKIMHRGKGIFNRTRYFIAIGKTERCMIMYKIKSAEFERALDAQQEDSLPRSNYKIEFVKPE